MLFLGVVASVVGYIGCFSVVQSTEKSTGPLSWLCLEATLSLLRMYIWGLNPQSDDAPPLEFILALNDEPPLPTCNKYSEYIDEDKVLPLTRADQFLNSVTSFAGLIDRFEHPDLTLYYCLTRKRALGIGSETMPGEWVLYIVVFDHKERTARVYTRGEHTPNGFRAIESSVPAIDLEHGVLEAELGKTIDIKYDPIIGVDRIRTLLEEHYESIMGPYSNITDMAEDRKYHIENRWTMTRADTMSAAHEERRAGALGGGASTVEPSHEATWRNTSQRDHQYLEQGPVERMLGMLYTHRGKWVEKCMALVMRETRGRFRTVRRVDGDTGGKDDASGGESDAKVVDEEREKMEELFIDEWCHMEMLLVCEVERWEEQVWERRRRFVGGSPEKQRLTREWRGNCWKRLDAIIRAMGARMDAAKTKANSNEFDVSQKWQDTHDVIQQAWQTAVERFMDPEYETSTSSPSMPLQRLEESLNIHNIAKPMWWRLANGLSVERLEKQCEEMASRLGRELEDVKERLDQGLERCDQFWVDDYLLHCRHPQSKILYLLKPRLQAPLEVYSRALKQNKIIAYIEFGDFDSDDDRRWIADMIRGLPWITSICVSNRELIPAIDRRAPLFIHDFRHHDIRTFLATDQQLAHSQGTFIFVTPDTIAVSFVGPTSGNLILRLTHRSTTDSTDLILTGTSFQLSLSSSLTVDDITLHPSPCEFDKPSFERGIRNNLIIEVVRWSYSVDDIRLLDQRGNRYDAAARCVLLAIAIDPLQPLIHHDLLQSLIQCHHRYAKYITPDTAHRVPLGCKVASSLPLPLTQPPQGHDAGTPQFYWMLVTGQPGRCFEERQ